jgi:predicted component of type VI protein secretion system
MDGMLFEDEQKKPRKQRITSAQVDAIYQAYPRHIAPADAKRAIKVALQKVDYATLLARVKKYAARVRQNYDQGTQTKRTTPYPATWIRAERWLDDSGEWLVEPDRDEKRIQYERTRSAEQNIKAAEREKRAAGEIPWWREKHPELLAEAEGKFPDRYRQVCWMKEVRRNG